MMKKQIAIALGATTMIASPALAQTADDAWSGFYLGAQATGARDTVDIDAELIDAIVGYGSIGGVLYATYTSSGAIPYAASRTTTDVTAGAFAGYQRQFGKVVVGIEGDFLPLRHTTRSTQNLFAPGATTGPSSTVLAIRDVRVGGRASARLRLGYAAGGTLFYLTGGYARAQGRMASSDSISYVGIAAAVRACAPTCLDSIAPFGPIVTTASESRNMSGWTAGGGVEQKIGTAFSIGLEYRRTDLRRTFGLASQATVNNGPAPALAGGGTSQVSTGPNRVRLTSDAVNVRVAFHF